MKIKAVEERYQQEMKVMWEDLRLEMRNQISQLITKLKPEIVREGLAWNAKRTYLSVAISWIHQKWVYSIS
jgi:hypothetical protein